MQADAHAHARHRQHRHRDAPRMHPSDAFGYAISYRAMRPSSAPPAFGASLRNAPTDSQLMGTVHRVGSLCMQQTQQAVVFDSARANTRMAHWRVLQLPEGPTPSPAASPKQQLHSPHGARAHGRRLDDYLGDRKLAANDITGLAVAGSAHPQRGLTRVIPSTARVRPFVRETTRNARSWARTWAPPPMPPPESQTMRQAARGPPRLRLANVT